MHFQIQYAKSHIDGVTERMGAAKDKLSSVWEEINKSEDEVAQEQITAGIDTEDTTPSQVTNVVSPRD